MDGPKQSQATQTTKKKKRKHKSCRRNHAANNQFFTEPQKNSHVIMSHIWNWTLKERHPSPNWFWSTASTSLYMHWNIYLKFYCINSSHIGHMQKIKSIPRKIQHIDWRNIHLYNGWSNLTNPTKLKIMQNFYPGKEKLVRT